MCYILFFDSFSIPFSNKDDQIKILLWESVMTCKSWLEKKNTGLEHSGHNASYFLTQDLGHYTKLTK